MPPSNSPLQDAQPHVSVAGLGVRFGRHDVLRGIEFEVRKGETLAIIGESGCGKTVLLKTIIGLVHPSQGKITFDGKNLTALSEADLANQRRRFGFVFQQAALFDSMTIYENVAFPMRQAGKLSEPAIEQAVHKRLGDVGLSEAVLPRRPMELSGGMRKRVGLARALAMEPEIILYDEPTTGLDPIMSDVINQLIRQTRDRESVTSIVVTHDMRTAREVADRVIMLYPLPRLRKGEPQILYDGRPEDLDRCGDERVTQFVHGEAGERLREMEMGM